MASAGPTTPARIHDVIEAMTDSLAAYLQPSGFLNFILSISSEKKGEILSKANFRPIEAMDLFLEWILDQEDSSESHMEFYQALKFRGDNEDFLPWTMLSCDGQKIWRSVTDMANLFVDLVDGDKFERVALKTIHLLLDVLVKEKIIKEKGIGDILEKTPLDAVMSIVGLIKRNKPDWPFIMWNILEQSHPDVFQCTALESKDSLLSISGLQIDNQSGLDSALESEDSLPSISEGSSSLIGNVHYSSKSQMPKKKRPTVRVTADELPEVEKLIDAGALSRNAVTVTKDPVEKRKGWKANLNLPDYSDDDTDDEQTDVKMPVVGYPELQLRDYQRELAEKAVEGRNVVICAPTGSGKTRVAMHIIIKHLDQSTRKNPRKVCFFARTVPLAVQQCKSISKYLPKKYHAFLLTGDSPDSTNLTAFLPVNDVFVMTPMILQNHFKRGYLENLSIFTLLVFDECHHTRMSEPYNTLMLSYLKMKSEGSSPLPQVLGLTASFPAEKANSVDDAKNGVLQICANLDADEISTVRENKDELAKTVPIPLEEIKYLHERDGDASVAKINFYMEKLEREAQQFRTKINDGEVTKLLSVGKIPTDRKCQQYNQWAVKVKKAAESVKLTKNETYMPVRILMIIADYLMHYNVALEAHDLVHLEDVLFYLDTCFKPFEENEKNTMRESRFFNYYKDLKKAMEGYRHEENPNLTLLEDTIDSRLIQRGENSRGIIFVKTRTLAEALANWLNRCGKDNIVKLRATIFTGTNAPESEGGMTQAQQDACVESFRKGEIRLLIATSVAEEGIDVPECNLVIKYNHVGNEISTIQTKGRSRKQGGCSVLLGMTNIINRELVNRDRAKHMFGAVDRIQLMSLLERQEIIAALQKKALKEQELAELMEQMKKERFKDKKFTMYCKKCRQTCVDSDYIKTIFGTHRVVTDWNIWKSINVRGYDVQYIDELKFIGCVRCRAFVEKNATCNGPLGMLVVFKAICFLTLGIKHFVFVEEGDNQPQQSKQWKKVKFVIDEIDTPDVRRYIEDSQMYQEQLKEEKARNTSVSNSGKDDTKDVVSNPKKAMETDHTENTSGQTVQGSANLGAVESSSGQTVQGSANLGAVGSSSGQSQQSIADLGAVGGHIFPHQAVESKGQETDAFSKSYAPSNTLSDNNAGNPSAGFASMRGLGTGMQSELSELSAYQEDNNHHQTKLVSWNTVTKNINKYEKKVEVGGNAERAEMDEDDPGKALDDAPPLTGSFD